MAAAQEAKAQHRAGGGCDWSASFAPMGSAPPVQQGADEAKKDPGPSSLFIFSETNAIRRYTRFIIEWPYPLILFDKIDRLWGEGTSAKIYKTKGRKLEKRNQIDGGD